MRGTPNRGYAGFGGAAASPPRNGENGGRGWHLGSLEEVHKRLSLEESQKRVQGLMERMEMELFGGEGAWMGEGETWGDEGHMNCESGSEVTQQQVWQQQEQEQQQQVWLQQQEERQEHWQQQQQREQVEGYEPGGRSRGNEGRGGDGQRENDLGHRGEGRIDNSKAGKQTHVIKLELPKMAHSERSASPRSPRPPPGDFRVNAHNLKTSPRSGGAQNVSNSSVGGAVRVFEWGEPGDEGSRPLFAGMSMTRGRVRAEAGEGRGRDGSHAYSGGRREKIAGVRRGTVLRIVEGEASIVEQGSHKVGTETNRVLGFGGFGSSNRVLGFWGFGSSRQIGY